VAGRGQPALRLKHAISLAYKKTDEIILICFGARNRNRTGTVSLPQDFKSHASRFCTDY